MQVNAALTSDLVSGVIHLRTIGEDFPFTDYRQELVEIDRNEVIRLHRMTILVHAIPNEGKSEHMDVGSFANFICKCSVCLMLAE